MFSVYFLRAHDVSTDSYFTIDSEMKANWEMSIMDLTSDIFTEAFFEIRVNQISMYKCLKGSWGKGRFVRNSSTRRLRTGFCRKASRFFWAKPWETHSLHYNFLDANHLTPGALLLNADYGKKSTDHPIVEGMLVLPGLSAGLPIVRPLTLLPFQSTEREAVCSESLLSLWKQHYGKLFRSSSNKSRSFQRLEQTKSRQIWSNSRFIYSVVWFVRRNTLNKTRLICEF